MSTNDSMTDRPPDRPFDRPLADSLISPAPAPRSDAPRANSPIVPRQSIAGRALVAVVAIMAFLASLTTGSVMLVLASAAEWQSDVAREMTIQIRPAAGRDLDADVKQAAEIARAAPGIAGYAAVLGQIILVAAVTALTSRQVVSQTLATIE